MSSKYYREDYKYDEDSFQIGETALGAVGEAVLNNHAVGFLVGYYDDALTILSVSEYLLNNLNYTQESFDAFTGDSLRALFYGENVSFLEKERFLKIHGAGEGHMLTGDGALIPVQLYKLDSVDADGTPVWVMSVRVDWAHENLTLMNEAIQSGPWYMDCDQEGNIVSVHWSHAFRRLLGYHDILDFPNRMESWSDLLHPSDHDATMAALYGAVADRTNETKYRVEYRLRMQDGSYEWFRAVAEVTRRMDGSARRIGGIFINIDKEKKNAVKLKKADAFHRAVTKANLFEYYVDLQENTFDSLKADSSLMEPYENKETWDELTEAFLNHYVCMEDREAVRQFYNREHLAKNLRETDLESVLESRIIIGNEYHWVRNIAVRGEVNGSRYALIFLRDITEAKKEAEDHSIALKKNAAMEHLVHSVSRLVDHFAVCDLEHDHFDYVNMALNTDYPPSGRYSDFAGMVLKKFKTLPPLAPLKTMFSPDYLRETFHTDDDILKFEYCSLKEDVYRMASLIPIAWKDGAVTHVLWTSTDITKAKKDEIKARRALTDAYQAADRANRAKTEFLSNMSHDIRTPMNAIVGMTAIAGANMDHPDRVRECLGKITASSRHLLGLINEVLDMARIESGKVSLTEEEFNLSELVDNLLSMIKPGIEAHHHNLEVRINKIDHEDVCGDSLRIQQVFVNLMSNAIKYTPDGGTITFSIEEKPNSQTNLACYEFSIEDTGIGMTPEFQKIMFEPFTRADDHRTTKVQGTGLGMAVTKNIVNMMNGDIRVASAPDKGTKVTMTLFLKLQNKDVDQIKELQNLPVLVVDDDKVCCESTVEILEEIGIAGEWVMTGKEAVDLVMERHEENNDFYAIIMDWKMPGMDGIETTRRIRERIGSDVTIIVLTSYDYQDIEDEAREAGVDAFISKPLFRSRLSATLKELVTGRSRKPEENSLDLLRKSDYTGKRILLVEDNDLNREIAKEILQMTGAQVETAANGKEACEKVAFSDPDRYDLVLMDIQMPVMNGYEATAAIRSLKGRRGRVPIVAMTANAFAEDVLMAKNTGMNEHLAKPLDLDKLNRVLHTWLRNSR